MALYCTLWQCVCFGQMLIGIVLCNILLCAAFSCVDLARSDSALGSNGNWLVANIVKIDSLLVFQVCNQGGPSYTMDTLYCDQCETMRLSGFLSKLVLKDFISSGTLCGSCCSTQVRPHGKAQIKMQMIYIQVLTKGEISESPNFSNFQTLENLQWSADVQLSSTFISVTLSFKL